MRYSKQTFNLEVVPLIAPLILPIVISTKTKDVISLLLTNICEDFFPSNTYGQLLHDKYLRKILVV